MAQRHGRILLAVALATWPLAASAEGRGAVGFSQAPEMSSGVCFAASIRKALDCARKKCIKGGGTAQDCLETTACFPAGWSIDIFAQSKDGPHWHETFCGFDSKETSILASRSVCSAKRRQDLMECSLVMIYNEDGKTFEPPAR
jgi:hypothetical protein